MPSAADLLAPSGPIAAALARDGFAFEPRPQQLAMAAAVEQAMDDRSRLMVEAGTGVGKSFAYLVPAILRCLLHNQRVVIATNTIALQEQLITKDIPLLQRTLEHWSLLPSPSASPSPSHRITASPSHSPSAPSRPTQLPELHPVLVKGRGNYVSIRRLQMASKRALTLFPDAASQAALHTIEEWAYSTTDGSLSTLPPIDRPAVWDRVQSDAGNCMGRACPRYKSCFYQNARREMDRGNLLICNHALFFSDLAIRARAAARDPDSGDDAGFLPPYHHLILDEAHCVEDAACEHFGLSLTESKVSHLLNLLYQPRTQRGYLSSTALRAGDLRIVDAAHHAVLEAHDAARAFFDGLALAQRRVGQGGGRLPASAAGELENSLSPAIRTLVLRLKALREAITPVADDDRTADEDRFELTSYILRSTAIADEADALINQSLPGYVYWIESSDADMDPAAGISSNGHSRTPRRAPKVRLACSPIEVAPLLRDHLFSRPISITLTSATLTTATTRAPLPAARVPLPTGSDAGSADTHTASDPDQAPNPAFTHISTTLGCDSPHALHLDSPFDYAAQVKLYIDLTIPDPRASRAPRSPFPPPSLSDSVTQSLPTYIDALSSRIYHHLRATDGGAFVLFTSFADLYAAADRLEPKLARLDLPLLVQGRRASRSMLLDLFKQNDRSVLFGAASFWQGVDVRGRSLRNVIITRLPFDPPDRPLTQARNERLQSRGQNPFMADALPRAIIRFKQGFGRLIRSRTDTGQIVILDPRLVTARYGRLFLDALPPGLEPTILTDEG